MEYKCPNDINHTNFVAIELGGTTPHYAKLICHNCGRFVKWLSKKQTEDLQPSPPEPPAITKCPISREPCMKGDCAWWWTHSDGNGIGKCLVARVGKLLSLSLAAHAEAKHD